MSIYFTMIGTSSKPKLNEMGNGYLLKWSKCFTDRAYEKSLWLAYKYCTYLLPFRDCNDLDKHNNNVDIVCVIVCHFFIL